MSRITDIHDFAVLGGGLAGLSFAVEVARRDQSVSVLEINPQIGGLSRTLVFGDYRFDLGGHRFYTPMNHVTKWVRDIMDNDLLDVPRRSRIFLNGRFFNYPLQLPNAFGVFSPGEAMHVFGSYVKAAVQRRKETADRSFEDWVIRRFGKALYEIYFRPYTEKVWGMSCHELSAEWASSRIRMPSLSAAIRSTIARSTAPASTFVSRFLYPPLGIGSLPDRIAEEALATGRADIHKDSRVTGLQHDPGTGLWQVDYLQAGSRRSIRARQVISTIPLDTLLEIVPGESSAPPTPSVPLDYRSLICVLLAADGPSVSSDTWTYFPDHHLVFGRSHEPRNWSIHMVPGGKTSLCLEIFCSEGDVVWQRPDGDLIHSALMDLVRLGFLSRERIQETWVVREPYAYPVYRVGYETSLGQVRDYLAQWKTLHLVGRTGSFRYLNIDGVIDQSMRLASELTDKV